MAHHVIDVTLKPGNYTNPWDVTWSELDLRLRDGDELIVWRIDRIGRSMIDVITTVSDLTDRGICVTSLSDGIQPSTREGRLMLNLMATFAEYERELIRERVIAGVEAARSRGVRFGRPSPDPRTVSAKVRAVGRVVEIERLTVSDAAALVGWSRATYYRHRAALQSQAELDGTQEAPSPIVPCGPSYTLDGPQIAVRREAFSQERLSQKALTTQPTLVRHPSPPGAVRSAPQSGVSER